MDHISKAVIMLGMFFVFALSSAAPAEEKTACSGYIEINKVRLYYEITGSGAPLLYLHGGLSSGQDFEKYRSFFSNHFQVIAIDRRGHGRSFDNNEPYSYAGMAEEMQACLEYLKIDSVYAIGWSDGGVVGLHLAARQPCRVKKLAAVGANYLVNGMDQASIEWIKTRMNARDMVADYPDVANNYKKFNPNPENFAGFVDRSRTMWLQDPYLEKEKLARISAPVLLIAGDRDDIRLEHMLEMYRMVKNSQLCILPNANHFIFSQGHDVVKEVLLNFLK